MTQTGRTVLAIDPGSKRIGLAISDDSATIAVPMEPVEADSWETPIAAILMEKNVAEIVVGLPVSLDGTERAAATMARRFAGRLEETSGLPVRLVDERLTTTEAQRRLADGGTTSKRSRHLVDSSAATILLQSYLESR